jgi:hypothetical protein
MVCEMGIHFMRVIDAILFVLLLVGNVVGLPIWWWLFGTPIMRFWRARCGINGRKQNRINGKDTDENSGTSE